MDCPLTIRGPTTGTRAMLPSSLASAWDRCPMTNTLPALTRVSTW